MKRVFSLLVLVALAACASPTPTPTPSLISSPTPASLPQRGLAVVDAIDVFPPGGPADPARVVAHGQLPNGCTSLAGDTVVRQAQTFAVTLSTAHLLGAACDAAGPSFRQEIVLDVVGVPAGNYVVVVNGVVGSLTLSGAATGATDTVSAPGPTATQIATPLPTATLPPTSSPAAPTGGTAACLDKAAFYGDVTIPDDAPFHQGQQFTKTWKVRNEGTCTWQGYALVFAGGDNMSAPLSTTLPVAVPDTVIQVSVDFVAPTRGGSQVGNWEFQDAQGNRFGVGASGHGPLWVKIDVAYSGQENVATPSVGNTCGPTATPDSRLRC